MDDNLNLANDLNPIEAHYINDEENPTEPKQADKSFIEQKTKKLKTTKAVIIIICILTLIFSCYQAYTSYNNAEYYKEQAVYFQQLRNNASKLLGEYEDLIFELSGIYGSHLYSEYSYYEDLYYEYNNYCTKFNDLSDKYTIFSIVYSIAAALSIIVPLIVSKKINKELDDLNNSCNSATRSMYPLELPNELADSNSTPQADEQK